jgi:photosystem II stability/assembly factor-like uncharacterized protein
LYITTNETNEITNSQPITGRLLKSTDYGNSWTEEFKKNNLFVNITVTENKWYLTEGVFSFVMLGQYAQGTMLSVRNINEPEQKWESVKISQPMNKVLLVDQNTGFITGTDAPLHTQYGLVLSTVNGGLNWEIVLSDNIFLTDINFVNESTGYYAADAMIWGSPEKNGIYKTTDKGLNWSRVFTANEFVQLQSISSVDDQLWTGGLRWGDEYDREGVIYNSSDGGENWDAVWTELDHTVNSIFHIDENYAWAVGEYQSTSFIGIVLKFDQVNGWVKLPYTTDIPLNNLYFVNKDIGFIMGGWYTGEVVSVFLKTTNGGDSWYTPEYPDYWVRDMVVDNNGKGWAVGQTKQRDNSLWKGVLLKTFNYGESWLVETDTLSSPLESISVQDSMAIAVGGRGLILRTTNNGNTWVDEDGDIVVSNYYLSQNYPNPFNPSTTIKYSIPAVETLHATSLRRNRSSDGLLVKLVIYDILGREVAILVDAHQRPGNYEVSWDASNFSSGIYFYKFMAGNPSAGSGQGYTETKKMILIK